MNMGEFFIKMPRETSIAIVKEEQTTLRKQIETVRNDLSTKVATLKETGESQRCPLRPRVPCCGRKLPPSRDRAAVPRRSARLAWGERAPALGARRSALCALLGASHFAAPDACAALLWHVARCVCARQVPDTPRGFACPVRLGACVLRRTRCYDGRG